MKIERAAAAGCGLGERAPSTRRVSSVVAPRRACGPGARTCGLAAGARPVVAGARRREWRDLHSTVANES
eukprot:2901965-Prymnesium_polylepis.1